VKALPWLRASFLLAYPGRCAARRFRAGRLSFGIEKERRRMRGPMSGR